MGLYALGFTIKQINKSHYTCHCLKNFHLKNKYNNRQNILEKNRVEGGK